MFALRAERRCLIAYVRFTNGNLEATKLRLSTSCPDPWSTILLEISRLTSTDQAPAHADCQPIGLTAPSPTTHRERINGSEYLAVASCVTIRILERGECHAIIAWHDPTSCHYEDQRWRHCVTRNAGTCAMSGRLIAVGDRVFKPARSRLMPVNASAMILASEIPKRYPIDLSNSGIESYR
ncbi:DUF3331 domain-containing protein [Paraburkholderia sp. RL18-103-BIB-C]|jgi:hypothetical protein|uniref:DUF3331 domain-containing protein n=1 Tax=unclassified Paraburkholderia TaxID=2615204 RepID=UPI0038BCAD43